MVTARIDRVLGLSFFGATGEITIDQVRDAVSEHWRDGATDLVLWDLREASLGPSVRFDAVNDLAAFLRQYEAQRTGGRTAIVATSPSLFGAARQLELIAHSSDTERVIQVFDDMEAARAWLGIGTSNAGCGDHAGCGDG